jgi:hypothetical protein
MPSGHRSSIAQRAVTDTRISREIFELLEDTGAGSMVQ